MNDFRKFRIIEAIVEAIGSRKAVSYQQLNYDVCTIAGCSYDEMIIVMNELLRYSDIVKKFLEYKGELKGDGNV